MRSKLLRLLLVILLLYSLFSIISLKINSVWDGKDQLNFIIVYDKFFLCSYRPRDQSLVIIQLPKELQVDVSNQLGVYQLKSVWNLSKLLVKNKNLLPEGKLLSKTIAYNLYFPNEAWLNYKKEISLPLKFNLNKTIANKNLDLNFFELLFGTYKISNWQTNLNSFDLISLFYQIKNIRDDKIIIYNLEEDNYLDTKKLNDGSNTYLINKKIILSLFKELFNNQKIIDENLKISIVNNSGISGLANRAADILTVLGSLVIQARSDEKLTSKTICRLLNKKVEKSYTLMKIKNIFDCKAESSSNNQRSDIEIIIGTDY